MSKVAAILGLAALAAAGSPQGYGTSSSAAGYGTTSSAPAGYSSEPSSTWSTAAPASSAPAYGGSSSSPASPVSSAPGYGGSSSAAPVYSSSAPASPTPTPACWSTCFQEAGITSESQLCGNAEVNTCIHDGCCIEEAWAYYQWYDGYCAISSSSVVVSVSASVTASASATPTADCWGKCFAENDITSEAELCGNTAVDECISSTCSCEEDKAYWQWYESYCTATTTSPATTTTPVVPPPTATPEDCWGKCFEQAGIASESELCGNTAVDACIHDTCSPAEDKAYWQWYDSYCPAPTTPVSTPVVTPVTTTPVSPVPTDNCWTDCFAKYNVTSEASLCGDDDVSACIHDTCSGALDKAYWDWYNGFCHAASSSVVTTTTVYTPTASPTNPITTTYVVTSGWGYTPVVTSPATTLPAPPAPPAPYTTYAPATGTAAASGYASPTASQWAPVPATGAGAATKPGIFFAAALALVALF